jgi:transcriptional regulator with XRE-family HTH domain
MDVLAKNLRGRAKELGLTQAEAARRSRVGERRYGNYVTGIRNPDLETLVRIARALQTTPNELLGVAGPIRQTKADQLRDEIAAAVAALDEAHLPAILVQVRALVAAS